MFSFSESNSYPLSYYHYPSTQERNNTTPPTGNHHQIPFHAPNTHFLPSLLNPPISENPININVMPPNATTKFLAKPPIHQEDTMNNDPSHMIQSQLSRKPAAKKDRHTKIFTAQGVRDRRVRLSISIARQFFSLQDMLGYDKASKTLEWLLTKSKAAIDELAIASTSKKIREPTNMFSLGIDAKGEVEVQINEEDHEKQVLSGKTSKKKRSGKQEKCQQGQVDAKEVRRAKARERARERTKKKKMSINLNHQITENSTHHDHNLTVDQQNLMICQSISTAPSLNIVSSSCGINRGTSVGEPVVIKSKFRGSSHNYIHDMRSKDLQEGYNHCFNDYLTKFASESNGAMVRQQGVPALNIINNLSTEIHINAKPWDTSSNQMFS